MSNVVWEPIPGSSQALFISCPYREALFHGSRGGGKTDTLLMDFAQHVGQGYGMFWRGIILRREYKELDDIVTKSRRWFQQLFPGAQFKRSRADYKWEFATGEELLFRQFKEEDDYWNYHGQEFPWIGWEELTTWPTPNCYDSMRSCNRSSFQPKKGQAPMPMKIRATTNPYGVGHNWVKSQWIDRAPNGTPYTNEHGIKRVSLFSSVFENIYLDEDYVNNLKSISDPNKRKAWLFGDWNVTSGGMFDDLFDPNTHILKPFEIPKSWRIDRSFDWGSSKPYAVCYFAESDGSDYIDSDGNSVATRKGDLFYIAEIYGWNGTPNVGVRATAREIAGRIKEYELMNPRLSEYRILPGPADTAIYTVENGTSIAGDMRQSGITWMRADKRPGSRKAGWEQIRQKFKNALDREGGGLYVFNDCKQFLRTIPTLPRDKRDLDDVDTDAEDHLADALRYRCRRFKASAKVIQIY